MVQFMSINFFLGFLQFMLGFSKVPVFFVSLCITHVHIAVISNVIGQSICMYKGFFVGTQPYHKSGSLCICELTVQRTSVFRRNIY